MAPKARFSFTPARCSTFSRHVEGADGGEWTQLPEGGSSGFDAFWDTLDGKAVSLVSVEEAARESRVMAELYASA